MERVPGWLRDLIELLDLTPADTIELLRQWQDFQRPPPYTTCEHLEELRTIGKDEEMSAWLLRMGLMNEREVLMGKALAAGFGFVNLDRISIAVETILLVPRDFAAKTSSIPVKKDGMTLWHAFSNPPSEALLLRVGEMTGCRIIPVLASAEEIDKAIDRYYRE